MGYIRHNAIVVTSWDTVILGRAQAAAIECGNTVTPIVESDVNGYATFVITPDGSKEGWDESDAGDASRARWREWARNVRHSDGSSALEWCEVSYGRDDREAHVVDSEWHSRSLEDEG